MRDPNHTPSNIRNHTRGRAADAPIDQRLAADSPKSPARNATPDATRDPSRTATLGYRILIPPVLVFVFLSVGLAAVIHQQMRRNAVEEAAERATLLLDHNLAIHTYFTHQLKPSVFALHDSLTAGSGGAERPVVLIRDLSHRLRAIAGNPERVGERVPLPATRELRDLSIAFNEMSVRIQGAMEDLETRVEARTQERMEAQRELLRAQATLQAAMDQSTAGIAIADAPDGRLRYVNDAGLGIRGRGREEVVNGVGIQQYVQSWQILHFDGTPYRDHAVPLARAVLYGETCSREFVIRRSPEDERVVLANAAPIHDDEGNVEAGIVGMREKAVRHGGRLEVRPAGARGTAVRAEVPVRD